MQCGIVNFLPRDCRSPTPNPPHTHTHSATPTLVCLLLSSLLFSLPASLSFPPLPHSCHLPSLPLPVHLAKSGVLSGCLLWCIRFGFLVKPSLPGQSCVIKPSRQAGRQGSGVNTTTHSADLLTVEPLPTPQFPQSPQEPPDITHPLATLLPPSSWGHATVLPSAVG